MNILLDATTVVRSGDLGAAAKPLDSQIVSPHPVEEGERGTARRT
jgi:hypothetical protein